MRIFVALPVDVRLACDLERQLERRRLERLAALRWIAAANYHLTLAFLGEQQEEVLPRVRACLDAAARTATAFVLQLCRLGCFGGRRAPHLLAALPRPAPALVALHFQLAGALRREGLYQLHGEYRPHISLARLRHPAALRSWQDQPLQLDLPVQRLVLYQSVPAAGGGVRYQSLYEASLRRAADTAEGV